MPKTTGLYEDGLKEGKWQEYNEDGILAKETRYKKGVIKSENVYIEEADDN